MEPFIESDAPIRCVICNTTSEGGTYLDFIVAHNHEAEVPEIVDLEDSYFDGQTLPVVLSDFRHVHSTTGVCVKRVDGPLCVLPTDIF